MLSEWVFSLPMFTHLYCHKFSNPMIWLFNHVDNGWLFFKSYVDITHCPVSCRPVGRNLGILRWSMADLGPCEPVVMRPRPRSFSGREKSFIFGAWRIWGLLIALTELEVCITSWRVLGDLWVSWGFFNLEEETVVCWCISVGKDAATYRILCGDNNSTLLPSILKGSCILTTINISPAQQVTIRQRGRWFFRFPQHGSCSLDEGIT